MLPVLPEGGGAEAGRVSVERLTAVTDRSATGISEECPRPLRITPEAVVSPHHARCATAVAGAGPGRARVVPARPLSGDKSYYTRVGYDKGALLRWSPGAEPRHAHPTEPSAYAPNPDG